MKAKKETIFTLELHENEFNTLKECLDVFESQGLNEKIDGKIGFFKLSSDQLITLNVINNYLEAIG